MGVIRYTFYSKVLGEQTNLCAVLPSFEPWRHREGGESYYRGLSGMKTLYIMHGGSDDSTMYLRHTNIESYASDFGLVVIFPEVRNSFYSNMVHGKRYFDYISEELPEMVQNLFPVSRKREDHFVLGNSMGSHGAFKWALNRPDFFAAAAGMSGAGDLEELGFYDRMPERIINSFGPIEEYHGSRNDFKYLYRQMLANGTDHPRFYACCGTSDPFYMGAKKFAVDATAAGFPVSFEEGEGGHEWGFWDRWLPVMLNHMVREG